MRRHISLDQVQRDQDDLLYRHFWSEEHGGLKDLKIQLIDRVNKREELRDREGQWTYRLNTLSHYGLNNDDFSGYKTSTRGESEIVKSALFLIVYIIFLYI